MSKILDIHRNRIIQLTIKDILFPKLIKAGNLKGRGQDNAVSIRWWRRKEAEKPGDVWKGWAQFSCFVAHLPLSYWMYFPPFLLGLRPTHWIRTFLMSPLSATATPARCRLMTPPPSATGVSALFPHRFFFFISSTFLPHRVRVFKK